MLHVPDHALVHVCVLLCLRRELVSELDMLKLWKGIYFCFWHSDKEPVQVRAGNLVVYRVCDACCR